MKIRSIELQNYKCFQKTLLTINSDFHTFIGPNSSGKTSLVEASKLWRNLNNDIPDTEIAYGGILENSDQKVITITFVIELSKEERNYYFSKYFHLSSELIELSTETNILNTIRMTLGIFVKKIKKGTNDNRVVIDEMAISDTDGNNLIPVLKLDDDGKNISVSQFEPGIKGPIVNEHLMNLKSISMDPVELSRGIFQFEVLHEFISHLKFIPSVRQVNSRFYQDFSIMNEEGSDLISLMHSMYLNDRERFKKIESICKRMLPDIAEIHPRQIQTNIYTLAIKKKNNPNEVVLEHEGSGADQLLIMIWLIATGKAGSIWFVDEPELHLHPGAQKLLYDFFIEETENGKQIFVTSHSMIFIYKSTLEQVTLLIYSPNGTNGFLLQDLVTAEQLNSYAGNDEIRLHLYEALGYSPSFAFEPETIVMVEGITDEKVLTSFSRVLGSPIDNRMTRFLVAGTKSDAKNFSPILPFAVSNKKCLIVLDNDGSKPQDLKNSILNIEKNYRAKIAQKTPLLNDENFYLLPEEVYSIEYYLLEPEAICKAFDCTEETVRIEIKNEIDIKRDDIDKKIIRPKDLLKEICERHFQNYHDVNSASKNAGSISRDFLGHFPEIKQLIESIAK